MPQMLMHSVSGSSPFPCKIKWFSPESNPSVKSMFYRVPDVGCFNRWKKVCPFRKMGLQMVYIRTSNGSDLILVEGIQRFLQLTFPKQTSICSQATWHLKTASWVHEDIKDITMRWSGQYKGNCRCDVRNFECLVAFQNTGFLAVALKSDTVESSRFRHSRADGLYLEPVT